MKKYILLFFFSISSLSQDENKIDIVPKGQKSSKSTFFKKKTGIKNPFNLRDPFKPPSLSGDAAGGGPGSLRNGVFTNLKNPGALNLDNIKIIGILLGKERRATAINSQDTGNNRPTFLLKEGMKINGEKVELKAILPTGVVFVEKFTNVYGQEEFLETVIPITPK